MSCFSNVSSSLACNMERSVAASLCLFYYLFPSWVLFRHFYSLTSENFLHLFWFFFVVFLLKSLNSPSHQVTILFLFICSWGTIELSIYSLRETFKKRESNPPQRLYKPQSSGAVAPQGSSETRQQAWRTLLHLPIYCSQPFLWRNARAALL